MTVTAREAERRRVLRLLRAQIALALVAAVFAVSFLLTHSN